MIEFTLPMLLPLLNRQLRTHWTKRRTEQRDLAWSIVAALQHPRNIVTDPARVTVERYCTQMPDQDNMTAACKHLLDVLCRASDRHPCGLGLIVDDAPHHCLLVPVAYKVRHRPEQRTVVRIEPWSHA